MTKKEVTPGNDSDGENHIKLPPVRTNEINFPSERMMFDQKSKFENHVELSSAFQKSEVAVCVAN